MTVGMLRWGTRVYTSRPPANCRAARWAWDHLSKKGPIRDMHLMDGYWTCMRMDGELDDIENTYATNLRWAARRAAQDSNR